MDFRHFDPEKGTLASVHVDAEVAQIQGLGDILMEKYQHIIQGSNYKADTIVQHILKICDVHFAR